MSRFGMTDDQLDKVKKIFETALREKADYSVWIYGSRARGDHRPYSDVDVLIEASPKLTDVSKVELEERLEKSNLPFKFDVVRDEELYEPYRPTIQNERISILEKK